MRRESLNAAFVALLAGSSVSADTVIVPTNAAVTGGSGAYTTVLHAQARSYQVVIGTQHLPLVPAGSVLRMTGLQWRMPSWQAYAAWPPVAVTFQNFDITLSSSLNPAGSLSATYTENIGPDAVEVRSGGITFGAGTFPGGAVSPSFNGWGPLIQFASHYDYTGGDLLITIRHTGNGVSSGGLDWVAGAGCQGIGVSSYTQPNEWYAQGNNGAIACRLTYTVEPAGQVCYPNCDGSTAAPVLNVNDFVCFQQRFAAGDSYANCDNSTQPPVLNVNDFVCFQQFFAAGCSTP